MRGNLSWHIQPAEVPMKVRMALRVPAGCDFVDIITWFIVRSKTSSAQADDTDPAIFVERRGSTSYLLIGAA